MSDRPDWDRQFAERSNERLAVRLRGREADLRAWAQDQRSTQMTPAERRRELIDDLRNLPPEWEWDFNLVGNGTDCGCALGRCEVLFGVMPRSSLIDVTLELLGLKEEHRSIFGLSDYTNDTGYEDLYGVQSHAEVTPEMVADALERVGQ